MNTMPSSPTQALQNVFKSPRNGVIGVVDDLLEICRNHISNSTGNSTGCMCGLVVRTGMR
jgi:hypothetical protein